MDRRAFLKSIAISAVAATIPVGTILSSSDIDIKFSRQYSLDWDTWILRGSFVDGDTMYAVDIKHSDEDDLTTLENMITDVLTERSNTL